MVTSNEFPKFIKALIFLIYQLTKKKKNPITEYKLLMVLGRIYKTNSLLYLPLELEMARGLILAAAKAAIFHFPKSNNIQKQLLLASLATLYKLEREREREECSLGCGCRKQLVSS